MLATLVIGLREGLEAALIVGIIAAFLRRQNRSLAPLWLGVGLAVLLSVGVGVGLEIISTSLPQAQQEGMESIIGMIAVVIVTGMIVWMSKNARSMRRDLERSAGHALGQGSVLALAGMAFLAVLREGFETSVFLLAAFQSSISALAAGAGAVIGLAAAVVVGCLIYRGGIRLNLAKFFTITGVFLVLVAAGLVLSSLRTAHEAGWINIGQATTVDLSWLVPRGSVQSALVTGVLGLPQDPRVIELLGWVLYLVPMLALVLWPHRLRPQPAALPKFQFTAAGVLLAAAAVLALGVGTVAQPDPVAVGPAAIVGSGGAGSAGAGSATAGAGSGATSAATAAAKLGTAELNTAAAGSGSGHSTLTLTFDGKTRTVRLPGADGRTAEHAGTAATVWTVNDAAAPYLQTANPARLSAQRLLELNGGRLPVGVDSARNPGPFTASWHSQSTLTVWAADGHLLDAAQNRRESVTISGGGLTGPRTFAFKDPAAAGTGNWQLDPDRVARTSSALAGDAQAASELRLYTIYLPVLLALAALGLAAAGARNRRRNAASLLAAHRPDDPVHPGRPDQRHESSSDPVQSRPGDQRPPEAAGRPETASLHDAAGSETSRPSETAGPPGTTVRASAKPR